MESLTSLRQRVKAKGIPYYSSLDRLELESFLSQEEYSLGWRWKYIQPVLMNKLDARFAVQMLTSPVRNYSKIKNKSSIRKLKYFLNNHPVVVTMTTSPIRLPKITAVLAMLDIEYITQINVVLPMQYGAKNEVYNNIPNDLLTFPKVKIVRIEKDMGPITKMLPVIKDSSDRKAIVISIDDDIGYPMGMIKELIYQKVIKHPKAVITMGTSMGFYGGIKNMKKYWPERHQKRPFVDLVEGWSSILYMPNLVNTECMSEIANLSRKCLLSDDFVISFVLALNKVEKVIVNNRYAFNPHPFTYGTGEDALHAGRDLGEGKKKYIANDDTINFEKYSACLENIVEYVKLVKQGKKRNVCKIKRNQLTNISGKPARKST